MGLEFVVTLLSCKNNKNPEIKLDRIEATRHHNQDVTKLKWEIVRTLCFFSDWKRDFVKESKTFLGGKAATATSLSKFHSVTEANNLTNLERIEKAELLKKCP